MLITTCKMSDTWLLKYFPIIFLYLNIFTFWTNFFVTISLGNILDMVGVNCCSSELFCFMDDNSFDLNDIPTIERCNALRLLTYPISNLLLLNAISKLRKETRFWILFSLDNVNFG